MANRVQFGDSSLSIGDKIRVYQKIKEGDKFRTQAFEGILLRIAGVGGDRSITVRKIAAGGIGVERIWPLASPLIEKIKRISAGKVRRAKLYYLRRKTLAKIKTDEGKERAGKIGGRVGDSAPVKEPLPASST